MEDVLNIESTGEPRDLSSILGLCINVNIV